jgi:hypothetical protein
MKKFLLSAIVAGIAVSALAGSASAQRYLDDYVGRRINAVKDDLREQGFRDVGRISDRRGSYALMFDGRTCLALHGGRGVIDDIDRLDRRDCDTRRRPRY